MDDFPSLTHVKPPVFAVIDVGTNSVKFHIGERSADGRWTSMVDRAEVTRLGEGFGETTVITPAALARTVGAIQGMVTEARRHGVMSIAAVGTAGIPIAAAQETKTRTAMQFFKAEMDAAAAAAAKSAGG